MKYQISRRVTLDVSALPYRSDLLEYLEEQKSLAQPVWLATASHHSIATQIADRLEIFDNVPGSSESIKLKGS